MMRFSVNVPVLLGCLVMTSACTTGEALTPLADIGGGSGSVSSAPITQPDAERMAETASRQPFASQTVESSALVTGYQQQATGSPPSSLDAQAEALERTGRSPVASAPMEPEAGGQPLSNAQAEEEDMGSAAPLPDQAASHRTVVPPAADASPPPPEPKIASKGTGNTVRFLPIIGAPVEAVTPLSRQLGAQARSHGLSIKGSNDTTSDYILKGYLSTFSDSGQTIVVYVWDVLDGSGNRLHRIQGQKSAASADGEGWSTVPPSVMRDIATTTIDEFSQWRAARGG